MTKLNYKKRNFKEAFDITKDDKKWQGHLRRKAIKNAPKQRESTAKEKNVLRFVNQAAVRLRKQGVKSEDWFNSLVESSDQMPILKGSSKISKLGHPNVIYNGKIPDIINPIYRFAIEVDGSIHNLAHVKENDIKKNAFYKDNNYQVFRIVAYNLDSFNQFILDLKSYLSSTFQFNF